MEKRPVIPVTVVFIISLAMARYVPLSIPAVALLGFIAVLAVIGLHMLHRTSGWGLVLVIFSLLGILIMKIEEQNPLYSSLDAFIGKRVVMDAKVISSDERGGAKQLILQPISMQYDAVKSDVHKAPRIILRYFSHEVKGAGDRDASGTLRYGDVIRVSGSLELLHSPLNPGMPDYTELRRRDGIGYAFFPFHCDVQTLAGRSSGLSFIRYTLMARECITSVLKSNHREASAGLLTGIIFGGSAELNEEVVRAFRVTGTYHILSASGMNVAILIIALMSLFKVFHQSGKRAALLAMPLVIVYTIMAGGTSSVIRAAVMAALALCALIVERRHDLLNTLFVAIFMILVCRPLCIYDAGFQMSAAGVIGIIIIAPMIKPYTERLPPWLRCTGEIAAVSCAVQLVIAPILAWHFNSLSLLAPLCNIIIVPPVGIILYCGLIEGIAGIFVPMLGTLIALFTETVLVLMIKAVKLLSGLPFCSICLPRPSLWSCAIYYLLLGLLISERKKLVSRFFSLFPARVLAFFSARGIVFSQTVRRWCWLPVIAALITVICCFCGSSRELRAVFLDVGQGDAIWITLPGGHQVLIDGGPAFRMKGRNQISSDAGERIVLPVLRAHGVGHLDLLLLSHGHEDHCGGVASIIGDIKVDRCGANVDTLSELRCREEMKVLTENGVEILPLRRGNMIRFTGGAVLRVLSSDEESSESDNENCLVVQIVYHHIRMLFMGDCEEESERRLLDGNAGLKSDLLKVGHHGSATSTSVPFLDEVSPRFAVISCGWKNTMGHPSPEVVERLRSRDVSIFRTDCDGAVIVTSDGQSMAVRGMKKHPAHSHFQ